MTPNPGLADITDTLIPLILISTLFYTTQGEAGGDLEQGPGQYTTELIDIDIYNAIVQFSSQLMDNRHEHQACCLQHSLH